MSKTGITAEVRHTDLYGWDVVYLLRGYEVGRDHIGKGNAARIDAIEHAHRYNIANRVNA